MKLTRKQLLGGAAAGALGTAGIYELLDQLADSPDRAAALELPPEQHLLAGMKTLEHENVQVIEPPLHHQVQRPFAAVAPSTPGRPVPSRSSPR